MFIVALFGQKVVGIPAPKHSRVQQSCGRTVSREHPFDASIGIEGVDRAPTTYSAVRYFPRGDLRPTVTPGVPPVTVLDEMDPSA